MAASTLTLQLSWENGMQFKMLAQHDGGTAITIIEMDENGHLASLWPSIQEACQLYFKHEIEEVGSVMKG